MSKKRKASRSVDYLNVLSPGPLVIVKVPWPRPRLLWRDLLTGMGQIMHSHNLRKKDIFAVESVTYFGPDSTEDEMAWYPKKVIDDAALLSKLETAFAGSTATFPEFWLYAWNGKEFELIRAPIK